MQAKHDFQTVKDRTDIVSEITRRTGLTTKKVGSSIDLEECPFCKGHDCFRITPEKGLYNCHQCESGGDVFTFVARLENCTKLQALESLAASCGLSESTVPLNEAKDRLKNKGVSNTEPAPKAEVPKEKEEPDDPIQSIRDTSARYYHERLIASENGLRHQTRTRKHSLAAIKTFQVGLTDGKLHEFLNRQGFTEDQRLASGLVKIRKGREQDYFVKGLFIYPHKTKEGRIGHFTIKDPRKNMKYQLPTEYKDPGCPFLNMPAFKNSDTLIVVEGENDLLSVAGRGGYPNVVACNGQISKEQIDYLVKWAPGKTIIACFDNDNAGRKYEEKLRAALKELCLPPRLSRILKAPRATIKIIRFDEKINDIDDYLKSRNDAKTALEELIGNAETVLMPLKTVMHTYRKLCDDQERSKNSNEMGELVFDCLNILGRFFVVGDECRLFFKNRIYRIGNDPAFKSMLYEEFGLNYAYSQTKQIVEVVLAKAYSRGNHTTVPGSIHEDMEKNTIYFNLHNQRNEIIKISPNQIQIIQNGTNIDGILLDDSPKMKALEYLPHVEISTAMKDLRKDVYDNLTCSPSDRFFVLSILFNTLLIPFTKAMGIMKFSGNAGSGKSDGAAIITILLYGEDYVTNSSTASVYAEATRSLLTVMDNIENSDITPDIKMLLLTIGSGIVRQKRKGGTDSDNVLERAQTQVILTAIEPFVDNELTQRTNDIKFKEIHRNPDYIGAKAIEANIASHRNQIFSAFFKMLAFDVLPGFTEKRAKAFKMLREIHPGHAKERLDELYSCLFLLLRELIPYIPHPEYGKTRMTQDQKARKVLDDWISSQDARAKADSDGTNPVLYRLEILLMLYLKDENDFDREYDIYCAEGNKNEAGQVTGVKFVCSTRELFSAFEMLSKNRGVTRCYRSPSQLGARINDSVKALEKNGWLFFQNKTTSHGERRHWFVKMLEMEV